jgi:hypothetical protein
MQIQLAPVIVITFVNDVLILLNGDSNMGKSLQYYISYTVIYVFEINLHFIT